MSELPKYKVETEDTILFVTRIIVLQAEDEKRVRELVKEKYPNSRIRSIKEYEEDR